MNIGRAADASGVSAKMIRYYEQIGLIRSARRTDGNYRTFGAREVCELQFIRRARTIGFSVEEIARLLDLWRDHDRPVDDIVATVERHVAALDERIAEMRSMAQALCELSAGCARGERPCWPVLPDAQDGSPA